MADSSGLVRGTFKLRGLAGTCYRWAMITGALLALAIFLARDADPGFALTGTIIIDDLDSGFSKSGGFLETSTGGYLGHNYYTWNATSTDEAYVVWRPDIQTARYYTVVAYIPTPHAWTRNARYKIGHESGVSTVVVNQQNVLGFDYRPPPDGSKLGVYRLPAGTASYVRLGDATGEPYMSREIGFDAMKFDPACVYRTEGELRDDAQPECRGTFVFDPGRGNYMSRAQLLANAPYYVSQGWTMNFLWYAPQTTTSVSTANSVEWSACEFGTAQHPGSVCPVAPLSFNRVTSSVPYGFTNGGFTQDVTLQTWEFNGAFIARVCGNFTPQKTTPVPTVSGYKFNDLNGDGIWQQQTEPPLENWPITLYDPDGTPYLTQLTAADGSYSFSITTRPGTYEIVEGPQTGWSQTTPGVIEVVVPEGAGNTNFSGNDFGKQQPPLTPEPVGGIAEMPRIEDLAPERQATRAGASRTIVAMALGATTLAVGLGALWIVKRRGYRGRG